MVDNETEHRVRQCTILIADCLLLCQAVSGRHPEMREITVTERLDVRLTREQMQRLKRIREIIEAPSDTEVVRAALKAYESLLNKRKV